MTFNRRTSNRRTSSKSNNLFKYIIWLIIFILIITRFFSSQINSIWDIQIPAWNYSIGNWVTMNSLPTKFNLNFWKVDSLLYKLWLRRTWNDEFLLQAWNYNIPETNLTNLFLDNKYLTKASIKEIEVTILPGYSIFDIDELLTIKWLINAWEFINVSENIPDSIFSNYSFIDSSFSTLEWLCYPDTYRFAIDSDALGVLSKCISNFEKKIKPEEIPNFKEVLNLASIIQKEERNPDNKSMVAWILQKRLDENWWIWADATVCYWGRVTHSECQDFVNNYYAWNLSIASLSDRSYDTRAFTWLPITPIWNVTEDTFYKTLNYEDSEYYFYLHGSDGQIHYAETLQGHVDNKKYL